MTAMEDVKIIKLVNGDDIVCSFPRKQLEQKSPLIRIVKPLLIKYVPQLTSMGIKDYIALIKWAAYTNDTVITIPKDKILTIITWLCPVRLVRSRTPGFHPGNRGSNPLRDAIHLTLVY